MHAVILLKPDAFQRRVCGRAFGWLEQKTDIEIKEARLYHPNIKTTLKLIAHYAEHQGKSFYDGLIEFMVSGPILAILVDTEDIQALRAMVMDFRVFHGPIINPANLIHCSDSTEAGDRETLIWFP